MILAVGDAELEALQRQTGTERESGTVITFFLVQTRQDAHLVCPTEVIAHGEPDLRSEQHVGTHRHMLNELIVPVSQVVQRQREAQRRVLQALRHTCLQVEGHAVINVVVGFHLSAEVLRHNRCRPLMHLVEVVQAEVYAHCHRVVVGNGGIDELRRDAARETLRQQVGEIASQRNILRRELPGLHVVRIHFAHRTIAHQLSAHRPCRLVADHAVEGSAARVHACHVVHVVQPDGLVRHIRKQSRVAEDERQVVVVDGDVLTAQRRLMRAHRKPQEVIRRLAFLCSRNHRKQRDDDG